MADPANITAWLSDLTAGLRHADAQWLTLEAIRRGDSPYTQEEEEAIGVVGDAQPHVTLQYAWVLTEIIDGLSQLPQFADGKGLAALHALRIDIAALHAGGQPARLQRQSGDGSANTGRRVAMANIVLCVRLLESIGVSQTSAIERVAAIFGAAGHVGQQRKPLSTATIYKWHTEICGADRTGPHAAGRRLVESELGKWRQSPLWPPDEASTIAFIERRAANPIFSLAHTT